MPGAKTLILDGLLQGDLDCGGHKLLNVDISNLTPPVDFGPVAQHTVFAGPTSPIDAIPVFRLLTADEVGAQPYAATLDILSNTIPSNLGLAILQITDTLVPGYVRATGSDTPPYASFFTPTQVRTDIQAQPLSPALTTLSPLTISNLGVNIIQAVTATGGYSKFSSLGAVSFITTAQLAIEMAGSILPLTDEDVLLEHKDDGTKQFRIDVGSVTPGSVRVMHVPNFDFTPATISAQEALINKTINGMILRVGTALDDAAVISYTQTPAQPMQFSLVDLSGSGVDLIFRLSAPADLVVREGGIITTEQAVPAGPSAPGQPGQTAYDADFEYRCTAVNVWKRVAISSWI